MADPHIKIRDITGGDRGEELKELHFQEIHSHKGEFHLFKGKEHIHTDPKELKSEEKFEFVYNDWCWFITGFKISEETLKAKGDWLSKSCIDNDDPESGTFQAQAGTRPEAEITASALSAVK